MERARGNGLPTPTRYAPAPLRALTDDAADDRGRPLDLVAADVEMGDGPQPPRTERDEQHPRLGELGEHGVHRVPFPHEIDHHDVRLRCGWRSEEHTSELQSHSDLVCRLLLEKKKKKNREKEQ